MLITDVFMMPADLPTRKTENNPSSPNLSFEEIQEIFRNLDKNNDGYITHAEFIHGLKKNEWIANKLGHSNASLRIMSVCKI